MFSIRRDIDSDPHILVFAQVPFHATRGVERLQNRNALFLNRFNRGRKLFSVDDSREQS